MNRNNVKSGIPPPLRTVELHCSEPVGEGEWDVYNLNETFWIKFKNSRKLYPYYDK